MGLGPAAVRLNLELWQRGFFKNIKSVVEMGSQELHLKPVDFEELLKVAGMSNYRKENFANLMNWPGSPRCSSRPFYEMLGVERYACVDLSGEYGAIQLDLNMPLEDRSLYGQYDLVTDHGTNEHAFNTVEAYRTMHRLCKKQGFLMIIQMLYKGNGYYTYDPAFFEGMAAANNYKILFSSFIVVSTAPTEAGSSNQYHVPVSLELLDVLDFSKTEGIGICYVMQKLSDSDFQYPYQGQYQSMVQGHYGYRLQFLPEPPSRTYIPVPTLEDIPFDNLAKHLFNRIKNTPAGDMMKYLFKKLFRKTGGK